MPSLAICTASSRDPVWPYCFSLARMMAIGLGGFSETTIQFQLGYSTDNGRCQLAEIARHGFSHILFLDDDMSFPPNTAQRLVSHGLPIVGANYTSRMLPPSWLALKNGQRVNSTGRSGLEIVDGAPTGVMMIETRVFESLPMPWFKTEFDPSAPFHFKSDDIFFCELAKRHGFDTYIDHDLSQEVGHIGSIKFQFDVRMVPKAAPPDDILELVREHAA